MNVTLFARNDVGPLVEVALVDSTGTDQSGLCGRGAQINPNYDDWACLALPDDDYELRVTAPADISVAIRCSFAALPEFPLTEVHTVALPQAGGVASCIVWAWPSADTYPPAGLVVVYAQAPAALLASTTLVLTDSSGVTVGGCTEYPLSHGLTCEPLPTGTYRAELAGAPQGTRAHLTCSTTSSDPQEVFGWRTVDEIVIRPGTQRVDCNLLTAPPTIEISAFGLGSSGRFSIVPEGGGSPTECTRADNTFTCSLPTPGAYELVTDVPLPFGAPQSWACADWGPARTTVTEWPAVFTVAEDPAPTWFVCSFEPGSEVTPTSGVTPTTIGGPRDSGAPSDTTGSEGPVPTTTTIPARGLPSTGGSAPLLPAALALLGLGVGVSLLARRPVR